MEHITINSDRSVTVPVELRKIGVQYDHNVNTIEFVGPRYSSNVDLSTMTIYINYILSDKTPGKYKAENVIIDDQDDSLIRFNWTITRNVTKVSGILSCLVCAKKIDEEGNEINHWNTDIFRLLSVSEGMENDLVIQEQYPDIITSLIQNVNEHDAKLLEFSGLNNRVTDLENNVNEHDAKLLEFSGLDTRVTDIENNVNELKDDLDELGSNLEVSIGKNLFDGEWHTGYYKYDGTIDNNATNYKYTNMIYIGDDKKISSSDNGVNITPRFIACFDSSKKLLSSYSIENTSPITLGDDVEFAVFTYGASVMVTKPMIEHGLTITKYEPYKKLIDVSHIEDSSIPYKWVKNEYALVMSSGYMSQNGSIGGSGGVYAHSQKISVDSGDIVILEGMKNADNLYKAYSMRFVCAFSGNYAVESSGVGNNTYLFTVPSGIDRVVVSANYFAYDKYRLVVWHKTKNENSLSKLTGKTIYAFGDSLVYGHYSMDGMLDNLVKDYGMMMAKYAVNGATIVGTDNGSISYQIGLASDIEPDFVIFDGLTNDCTGTTTIGSITDSFNDSDFNTSEFCGAFEHICYTLRNKYPNSNIIYVAPHNMVTRTIALQEQYQECARNICDKWGIPLVDIFREGQINTNIDIMRDAWSYDNAGETSGGNGTHLTGDGYKKWYQPHIIVKMLEVIN